MTPSARFGKQARGHGEGVQNVGGTQDMIRLDMPSVPLAEPPGQRREQAVRHRLIPEHAMLKPRPQGIEHRIGRHEVHVGDTGGEQVFCAIAEDDRVHLQGGKPPGDRSPGRTGLASCLSSAVFRDPLQQYMLRKIATPLPVRAMAWFLGPARITGPHSADRAGVFASGSVLSQVHVNGRLDNGIFGPGVRGVDGPRRPPDDLIGEGAGCYAASWAQKSISIGAYWVFASIFHADRETMFADAR